MVNKRISKKEALKIVEKRQKNKQILIWSTIIILFIISLITIKILISIQKNNPTITNPNNLSIEQIECIGSNYKYYGTQWCKFCVQQKEILGSNLAELSYINCEKDKQLCIEDGIEAYPTAFAINKNTNQSVKLVGVQSIEKIIDATGCYS